MKHRFVPDIIDEISSVSSRLAKEAILTENKDNVDLQEVLKATYNPFINYYINKIPDYNKIANGHTEIRTVIKNIIIVLAGRQKTGNAGILYLIQCLEELDKPHAELLEKVIKGDLRAGFSVSTCNKIFGKGFIPVYSVMLAEKLNEKTIKNINFPAHISTKLDGARVNIVLDRCKVSLFSRSGKELETHGHFDEWKAFKGSYVIDGELLFKDDNGNTLPRKKSNGLFNKMVKGTISAEEMKNAYVVAFDMISLEDVNNGFSVSHFYARFDNLIRTISVLDITKTVVVPHQTVDSLEEAQKYYSDMLSQGEEGAMLRNLNGEWKGKRSNELLKMKAELTCELKIEELTEGTGKYKGFLGNFVASSSCGKLSVGVGSGLSDAQRKEFYNLSMIGQIIEVKYNELIQNDKDEWSLFLPIFLSVRNDKTEANSLDDLNA